MRLPFLEMSLPAGTSLLKIVLALLVGSTRLCAQDTQDTVTHWKKKLDLGIHVNQASFSSNWTGGGVNSIGLNASFNYIAKYSRDRHSWDNEIGLQYGFVKNEGQGFRKTLDKIFLDTKYGYSLSGHWNLFTSLNFLSQFAPGYSYATDPSGVEISSLISDFLAPAFVTSAWGFEYHPGDFFRLRVSPFAPRLTVVRNPERFVATVGADPYGVIPPDDTRLEWLAFQLIAEYNKDVAENLNLKWRYAVFGNYETFEFDKIDHRLEATIMAKVNKFINVSLGGIMLYDYDQVDEIQMSQVLTLGFAYHFQNYTEAK
jgi:hypothetical protein